MSLTIRQKADTVGTFRYLAVTYMETLSRWVPTTPEMEIKIIFGRHIWELAQHADQLGQRTHELRAALHYDREPAEAYKAIVDDLAATEDSAERFYGFYGAALPDLSRRCRTYIDDTDTMLDEPTVRILERIGADVARMLGEFEEAATEVPQIAEPAAFLADLRARFEALEGFGFVAFRPERETNLEIFS